ncbi:MAG TPA: effector immunity protein Tgi2PP, partial [Terracidiphilus sp.]|nr:effector immunity protein Tgi2PP [Terracidiphilus sp.]
MKQSLAWFAAWFAMMAWLGVIPAAHALTRAQARALAVTVARHEGIPVTDEHIEIDTMDVGAPYLPGFASFLVLRESTTPGPDTTLARYAVNRRSGNVWEMTECRRYDFPALKALRKRLTGHATASRAADAAERKALGCDAPAKSATAQR